MPLTVALNSMTHLESKGIPAGVSRDLKQEVTEGRGLSEAMAKQPRIFSDLYVNMVRAGEQSGSLEQVLRRMADHFSQFAEVQAKFKSALIYPAMVCCVGAGIVAFFMFFMMPKFMEIFNGFGVELPLPTKMLMGFSKFFIHYWWLLGLAVIVVIILFKRFQASEEGARRIDGWKNDRAYCRQGGKVEPVWAVRAHAWNLASEWRAGPDRIENHGAGLVEPADQGGDRQDP